MMDDKAQQAYDALLRQVNGPSSLLEKVVRESFRKEHPTLQQAFIRHIVRPVLEELVAQRQYADRRNAGATSFAVAALEATRDIGLPLI